MKKRIITLLLTLIVGMGLLPNAALAASSETEALGEVQIFNGGTIPLTRTAAAKLLL